MQTSIIMESSKRTPIVILEPGRIFIMGRSIPDNPGEFWLPVLDWVSEYIKSYEGMTRIDLGFEYINTSSTKYIFLMLRELSKVKDLTEKAGINWYYEHDDDDMAELGFMLRPFADCPFVVRESLQMNRAFYDSVLAGNSDQSFSS